jgi:ribonuclease H2 subunit A
MEAQEGHKTSLLPPSLPSPLSALTDSYTYHSSKPTANGPYILGVDEAGRGPVLGPLVYAVAYCPVDYQECLGGMGFAGIFLKLVPKSQ